MVALVLGRPSGRRYWSIFGPAVPPAESRPAVSAMRVVLNKFAWLDVDCAAHRADTWRCTSMLRGDSATFRPCKWRTQSIGNDYNGYQVRRLQAAMHTSSEIGLRSQRCSRLAGDFPYRAVRSFSRRFCDDSCVTAVRALRRRSATQECGRPRICCVPVAFIDPATRADRDDGFVWTAAAQDKMHAHAVLTAQMQRRYP